MSVYNKIGGGVNKVLIDNKPPADRLNLTEVEGIIKNRAKLPFGSNPNYSLLTKKKDVYYISCNGYIYKGNPYNTWTEIIDINKINSIVVGYYYCAKINNDESLDLVYVYPDSNTSIIDIVKIKNKNVTLIKRCEIPARITNLFMLNDTIYCIVNVNFLTMYKITNNGNTITDISKGITFENNTSFYSINSREKEFTNLDKRYQINLGTPITITEFDGKKVRVVKEINNEIDARYAYSESFLSVNSDENYFTIESDDKKGTKNFQLIDKNFNIIKSGETVFPFTPFLVNSKQEYIVSEHVNSKCLTLVEFPVKAYVRRE